MIRNIVYDVGYVLVNYSWKQKFREFGYDEEGVSRLSEQLFGSRDPESIRTYWEKYDMNEITDQEIEAYCYTHFPADRKALEWFFAVPSEWCVYMSDLADTIGRMKKKGYHIYLLSNYPERLWREHLKNAPFRQDLDGAVVSWQERCGKPEKRFYRALFDRYGLLPDECLFLDDRRDNTEAAEQLGMQSITLDSESQRRRAVQLLDGLPELT